jgi:hypothetical protein
MSDRDDLTPDQQRAAEAVRKALETFRERAGGRAAGAGIGLGLGALALGVLRRRFLRAPRLGRRRLPRGRLRVFGIGALVVVLSVATCSAGVDTASLTAGYGPPVPASTESARRLIEKTTVALQGMSGSRALSLSVTESEATSALSLGLMMPELMRAAERIPAAEIQQISDLDALRVRIEREERDMRAARLARAPLAERLLAGLDPRLRAGDVQVRFRPSGEVVVAGHVQAWRFRQPALFVVAPHGRSGELQLDFVEGRLGRLPLPEPVFDLLGRAVASAILLGRDYAEISDLTVGDGTLRIVGRLR